MKNLLQIAVVIGLGAVSALAQQPQDFGPGPQRGPGGFGGPGGPGGRMPPMPLMIVLDANTNRVIEAAEIANAPAALATLDMNGDGQLTLDEVLPPPPQGMTNRPPVVPPPNADGQRAPRPLVPPIVAALDANHDGVIDATEIANASAALLTLDANGDGQLTGEEIRPPFHRGPGGPHRFGPEGEGPGGPPPADQ